MDVHARLVRDLTGGTGATVIDSGSTAWASVTFVGARHHLRVRLPADAADRLCAGLAEREFAIPGQIVADVALVARHDGGGEAILAIEALTIEDH